MTFLILFGIFGAATPAEPKPFKVGWIGALSGPTAKWGAYQAAQLALEEVNKAGGINGRPLQIIFEDTACNGLRAVSAFQKLTNSDNVSFILGGHCSPDSLAFAPLAERKNILSLAAITSSPKLSEAGENIFRVTPVSTILADLIVPYARKNLGLKRMLLLHELTDYVIPVAEKVKSNFQSAGGSVIEVLPFNPGEIDFRALLLRAASAHADALHVGVQAPDTAILLMKQLRELNIGVQVFGNEQFGGAFLSAKPDEKLILENVVFAQPKCDQREPAVKAFSDLYTLRYQVDALPFSCYTAEPYDTVQILSKALHQCGEDGPCVKRFLNDLKDYPGASGRISFDARGDVNKEYVLQKITKDGFAEIP